MKFFTNHKTTTFIGFGIISIFLFSVTNQYTDTANKDKEQLELVVRDVVKSEFEKQRVSFEKMIDQKIQSALTSIDTKIDDRLRSKVAFIDAGYIFENMTEFKDQKTVYQKKFTEDQKELQTLGNSIMQEEKELVSMGNAMNATTKQKKEEKIATLRVKGEMMARNLEKQYAQIEQELHAKLLREIASTADELLKKENRMIVLAGGIAAADPGINYSDKVLEQTNKKYEQRKKKETASATTAKSSVKPITLAAGDDAAKPKVA